MTEDLAGCFKENIKSFGFSRQDTQAEDKQRKTKGQPTHIGYLGNGHQTVCVCVCFFPVAMITPMCMVEAQMLATTHHA